MDGNERDGCGGKGEEEQEVEEKMCTHAVLEDELMSLGKWDFCLGF